MGVTVFWIMFWLLVAVLVASTLIHDRNRKNARYEKIKSGFGRVDQEGDAVPPSAAPALLGVLKRSSPDDFCIDDITWNDLDLDELYKRMNRCVTSAGDDHMYCRFRMLSADIGSSKELFRSIRHFIADKDKAVRYIGILDRYGKHDRFDDLELISSVGDKETGSITGDIVCLVLLAASLASIAVNPLAGLICTLVMIIVSIGVYFSGRRKMEEGLLGLSLSLKLIDCANRLSAEGLDDFKKYDDLKSLTKGKSLIPFKERTVSDPFSIIFDYVRMITHIDLIVYRLRISKLIRYKDRLIGLYTDIGRTDTVLAMASYLAGRKHCLARIVQKSRLSAKQMYHPLVSEPVCNDIDVERGVVLTGSNASGKSTFLKATGINLLFARSFGFAFADSFECANFDLYTSMALTDNILGSESYYVVEARSIKRICDAAEKGMCLCIIDEVLRGTNTVERIAASSQILKFLCKPGVICFAATHDLELTHLLRDEMDLYYFTEEINGDDVKFTYTIQSGYTDKTNAIRLLDMLGFDEGIVSSADCLVKNYRTTGKW